MPTAKKPSAHSVQTTYSCGGSDGISPHFLARHAPHRLANTPHTVKPNTHAVPYHFPHVLLLVLVPMLGR